MRAGGVAVIWHFRNITKGTSLTSSACSSDRSQIAAAALLLPFTFFYFPTVMPGALDWFALIALGVFCTGIAYALYFRLIARIGPAKTMAVTFLIPAFAILWGVLFLAESVTLVMLGGCAVILMGTALATQMVSSR